ncbi:GNAT family N-acetyltransferase [Halapricum desulfuricans]|uniref:Acetyltransferase (GNAT) family n=1 Tax=Halapricum desulfuricans TaxID=2841257 RepID=A0A897NS09_9EURY|nr:GNAT family N-acetyltransferase [Halapricum desulfuricans]QSG14245.1 Acetyltransferase (GNAT) family [Halapricum desulfuricans]
MTDATIRRFEPGDTDAVLALNERAMAAEGTDPEDVPGIDDLRRIESEYLDSGGEFLVADLGGDIVGMGGLTIDGETAEVFRMRVDPDYQRSGLGSALLDRLERAARERGATRLLAETARRQQAATEFYPAHGFEEQGRRSFGEYELIQFERLL